METANPSLRTEGRIFKISTGRADQIEKIAKDVKTMFISWDDFVRECLPTYVLSWTDPAKALQIMQGVWLPHFKLEQLEFMKRKMAPKDYKNFTANMEKQKKGLRELPFNPSQMGPKSFKVDGETI